MMVEDWNFVELMKRGVFCATSEIPRDCPTNFPQYLCSQHPAYTHRNFTGNATPFQVLSCTARAGIINRETSWKETQDYRN